MNRNIDIIKNELNNWNISSGRLGYTIIIFIVKECSSNMSYDEIIQTLMNKTKYRRADITNALGYILKHADFSKSKYILELSKMKPKEITKEILVDKIKLLCD